MAEAGHAGDTTREAREEEGRGIGEEEALHYHQLARVGAVGGRYGENIHRHLPCSTHFDDSDAW